MKNRYTLRTVAALLTAVAAFSFTPAHAATITVNSNQDNSTTGDSLCTLREAIQASNNNAAVDHCASGDTGADTITFAAGLQGQTITLTSQIDITDALTIDAMGRNLTISGNNATRIFHNTAPLTLDGITLTKGNSVHGGAILSKNALIIRHSTLSFNTSTGDGGAIYALALAYANESANENISIHNSTLVNNTASNGGGAIYASASALANANAANAAANANIRIHHSTLAYNTANNGGGAIHANAFTDAFNDVFAGASASASAILTLNNSILLGNKQGASTANNCAFVAESGDGGTPTAKIDTAISHHNLVNEACGLADNDNNNIVDANLAVATVLQPLADNGGGTKTMALVPSSATTTNPAINAGSAATGSTDQRGVSRPQGSAPDIGAYELYDCTGSNWIALNEGDLNAAIACFNGKTTAGDYTINLADNIILTASLPEISNTTPNVTLTINGNGKKIDGEGGLNRRVMKISNGTVTIDNTTITGGNEPRGGGGGLLNIGGDLTVTNSTISGNKARQGGGIQNYSGTLTLKNTTISGNTTEAYSGGGIENRGTLTLTNSTVSRNTATNDGGGIFNLNGTLTLTNSIIANNKKGTGASATLSDCKNTSTATGSNNLIQDSASACGLNNGTNGNIIGVTDAQLNLGPLANNGGATQTHALLPGSPAIDKGKTGTGIPTTDQRGFARTAPLDIGAFEAFDGCTNTSNSWDVADEAALTGAILCFNAKTSGTHSINLTADINLRGSTPFIDNDASGVTLIINGNGKTIDGKNIVGVRPITVAKDTTVTIDHTTITGGNTVFGGGIVNRGTLTLTNSTVRNNSAVYSGGIDNQGTLTLTNSTVNGNTANQSGGAIVNSETLTLINSTVSANTATIDGGGIENWAALTLINSTVSNNTAGNEGGGVDNYGSNAALTLRNTLIAHNTLTSGAANDCVNRNNAPNATGSNNLIQSDANACGLTATNGNIIGKDPKLGDLANNGGATQTHALLAGSPAFNAGTSTGAPDKDQRGISRTANGAPDIGAYEARLFALTTNTAGNGTGNVTKAPVGTQLIEGSTVELTANPDAGSTFDGWGDDCSGTASTCTVTMDATKTVTATFTLNTYALTLKTDGDGTGSISGANSGDTFDHGSTVKLTAIANPGSTFNGWDGGGCSGTASTCTVTMDATKTVTATFTKNAPPPTNGVFFKDSFE